jgi:D-sedoheptulose 7-phosphate isomerase
MANQLKSYFQTLGSLGETLVASDGAGREVSAQDALDWAVARAQSTHAAGHKLVFVGNGGSAAIASHMATDYSKNGRLRSMALNDGAMLTCLANDLGFENVFAHQIEMHGKQGDLLIAISSSGNSQNIINAVRQAREQGMTVMTLSGFKPNNKLRSLGDMNLHLPDERYGFVEIGHLAVCHAILDICTGISFGLKDNGAVVRPRIS